MKTINYFLIKYFYKYNYIIEYILRIDKNSCLSLLMVLLFVVKARQGSLYFSYTKNESDRLSINQ